MKDSAKLLTFSAGRKVKFNMDRNLDFSSDRDLSFITGRNLSFNLNRNLEIRKRGVVFRGYVCPKCEALVAVDSSKCDECGVKFDTGNSGKKPPKRQKALDKVKNRITDRSKKPPTSKSVKKSAPAKKHKKPRTETHDTPNYCSLCGNALKSGATKCNQCGAHYGKKSSSSRGKKSSSKSKRKDSRKGVTVTAEEYAKRKRSDGVITWEEYSKRNKKK